MQTGSRIAIAHDYLTQRGGAERVVLALHRAFPEATIYTTLYDPEGTFPEFRDARIVTSPLNRIPFLRRDHRKALPLLPLASSLLRVPEETAVVSSSGWAHGFRYAGRTLVYCHTPARWVYLTEEYLGDRWYRSLPGVMVTALKPALRLWDRAAQRRRDRYVGNSTVVRQRIRRVYGDDEVGLVFPPHSVDPSRPTSPIPGLEHLETTPYALVVSRLMPYKNVDVVIRAAEQAGVPLLVVGKGPEREPLRAMAGPDVHFGEDLPEEQLAWAYRHASLLVAASHEDFGITPLEASAHGVPTVALRAGGYLDTIVDGVNGVYVDAPTVDDVADGIRRALERDWGREAMLRHAETFSEARFIDQIRELLAELPGPRAGSLQH